MQPHSAKPSNAERRERPFVLQPAELALDGATRAVELRGVRGGRRIVGKPIRIFDLMGCARLSCWSGLFFIAIVGLLVLASSATAATQRETLEGSFAGDGCGSVSRAVATFPGKATTASPISPGVGTRLTDRDGNVLARVSRVEVQKGERGVVFEAVGFGAVCDDPTAYANGWKVFVTFVIDYTVKSPPKPLVRRRCGSAFSGPDEPGFAILTKGVSCGTARGLVRRQIRGGCPGDFRACDIDGFSCGKRSTGDLYRVQCRRGRRSFSWGGGS